jgi:tetratricopeptide (TPR) repeat protein
MVILGMGGCVQQPPKAGTTSSANAEDEEDDDDGRSSVAATSPAEAEPPLPGNELTQSLLYEFLLAEIAGQRGNAAIAAQTYVDIAKRTRDPRIARRATEIAIFARMNSTAVDAARIWRETDPKSQRAVQVLSSLLVSTGRLQEAEPHLQALLSEESANIGAAFSQLGRTLSTAQNKEAALGLLQKLAQGYDAVPQAHYAIAQAASGAGQTELALKEVQRARALRPEWEAAALLESQLQQKTSGQAALDTLSGYLQKYPNAREIRLNYARLLVSEKRFGEARSQFQKLLSDFPGNTEVVYAVALLSVQLNDYTLAETNLRRLLDMDYRDKDTIRLYLGQVSEEQGKYDDALKWYESIQGGDQFIPSRIRSAQLLGKQGKVTEAREWLRRVETSGDAQRVQLVLAEAQLLRDANRDREAFDVLGKALQAQPEQPDLLYDYAMLAERLDRVDILETSLRKVIAIRPEFAHAYNALGYSLADRNQRLPEARDLIQRALQLAPDDLFIADSMGWVLYRQGLVKEALEWLRRAYSGRPDPEIAAHLGEVLWVSGDQKEAERIWKEAGEKSPGNDTLTRTIKRLKP